MKNKVVSLFLAASMLFLCGQPVAAAGEEAGLLPVSECAAGEENALGTMPEENVADGTAFGVNVQEALTGSPSDGTAPAAPGLPGEGLLIEEDAGTEGTKPAEAATETAELSAEEFLVEEIPEDASESLESITGEETELLSAETEATEEMLFEPEDETEEMTESTLTAAAGGAESAGTIALNREYTDRLTDRNDENWYRFTLSEAGYVSLTFSHEYFPDTANHWSGYFYKSNTEEFFHTDFNGTAASAVSVKLGLPAGSYYLKISRYRNDYNSYDGRDYRVKINYTSSAVWETEFNSEASLADPIAVNTVYNGSLMHRDDVDWYRFTLGSAGYISLNFAHEYFPDADNHWEGYLYDSNMKEFVCYYYAGSSASSTGAHIGLPAGNYYLKIQRYRGNYNSYDGRDYSVKINYTSSAVWETEFNDASDSADPIALNTTYNGSLRNNRDVDWYRFTVTSVGEQHLQFQHGYSTSTDTLWRLTLYNSAMTKLDTLTYAGNITSNMDRYRLSAGTYYIKIETGSYYNYSTDDYKLWVGTHTHNYQTRLTKATLTTNGKSEQVCSCGAVRNSMTIYYPSSISLSSTSYTYTGKAKKPSVTVKGSDGKLIASSNYTVSYAAGRANVGQYNVSITFKGNYSGTVSRSFTIYPAKTKIKKLSAKSKGFTVKWNKKTKQVSGYQIQYSLYSSFFGEKTKTVTKNTTASLTCKGLKAKRSYYVRIRTYKTVSGKKYYSSWSPVKAVVTKK